MQTPEFAENITMQLSISDIINRHKGKKAWVLANGPSTKNNLNYINSIIKNPAKRNQYVFFVCNEIDIMLKEVGMSIEQLRPEYWVIANSIITVDKWHNNFNQMTAWGGTLLYANSVDWSIEPEKKLIIDFLPYDQRHFDQRSCNHNVVWHRGCCKFLKKEITQGRLTVQEELQRYTNDEIHYGSASTVALHMLAFSILTGCNNINISGVDLDYSLGYFDNKTVNHDSFSPHLKDILIDFKIIKDCASRLESVNVRNLSLTSPLQHIFLTGEPL